MRIATASEDLKRESDDRREASACLQEPPTLGSRSRRVRLCLISPRGDGLYRSESKQPFGGAELRLYLLAQTLASDPDLTLLVLTTVDGAPGWETHGNLTVIRRQGRKRLDLTPLASILGLPWAAWHWWAAFGEMYRLFRRIDADAYVHIGAGVEVGAYALICRLQRRRFLFMVASSADLEVPYGGVRGPLRWLFPLGVRLADTIVCQTHDQQDWLRRRYSRNGVLLRTGHPTEAVLDGRRSTVLWVGRIIPLKQPLLFLDLAEQMGDETCVMAAMPDRRHDDLWRAVRERAAALPNVTLHERVDRSEIGGLFAQAKVFVNTSVYEGFPNTFVEAAMHAIPVVSWKVNPDRILTDEAIGRCADGSFERMLSDTRELCKAEGVREGYARRARSYALAHHDIRRVAEALKSLLLGCGPAPEAGGKEMHA